MKSKIDKLVAGENNNVTGAVVDGETIPADFVIMGVGVAPATEFLKSSGLTLEKDGGVKVDQYLRVKSGPDQENVYAIGTCAAHSQSDTLAHRIQVTSQFTLSTTGMRLASSTGMWLEITDEQLVAQSLERSSHSRRSQSFGVLVSAYHVLRLVVVAKT
jgi:Pyridine nucleotide-disulphide oxidoreductase